MNVFKWLRRVWRWFLDNVVCFFSALKSSKHDHDSDASSDEYSPTTTPAHKSGTPFFDDFDNDVATNKPMKPIFKNELQYPDAPKRNLRGDILTLKNPYCVVIVNIHFHHVPAPRNGAQADLENIRRLLCQSAGFTTVHEHIDKTRKDLLKVMDHISTSKEIAKHDGLIVFISSHGKRKGVLTYDKEILKVDEMTSRVNGKQCEHLRGKPKLFFISACRGKKTDAGVPGPVMPDASWEEKLVPRLPTDADFLICFSTTMDHISMRRFELGVRNTNNMGTWLISSLTQIFEEHMKDEDIMQMLSRVNSRVANMSSHGDHVDGLKQMPVQMHMLRHRVFLGSA